MIWRMMVAAVQAATTLPVFLLALPAGALPVLVIDPLAEWRRGIVAPRPGVGEAQQGLFQGAGEFVPLHVLRPPSAWAGFLLPF